MNLDNKEDSIYILQYRILLKDLPVIACSIKVYMTKFSVINFEDLDKI